MVPAWSPDGKKIAFLRGDFEKTLWAMNPDGSGKRQLADDVSPQAELVWKPQSGLMAIDLANSGLCRVP